MVTAKEIKSQTIKKLQRKSALGILIHRPMTHAKKKNPVALIFDMEFEEGAPYFDFNTIRPMQKL